MRSSAALDLAHTARTLSQRRLVRVQLKKDVPGLGSAGATVLVQPGRMRNDLLPHRKAIYEPLPTPFQLSNQKLDASIVEEQIEAAQAQLAAQQARESIAKQLGPLQLLSLRRKLESSPPIVCARQTTTKFRPSVSSASGEFHLPKPALGIQGSIQTSDVVAFLRQNGAFDLETQYSQEGKQVPLHRLTQAQINATCDFILESTQKDDSIDKLGRIKKTGKYNLVAHILASNIRVRIPVVVRPNAASTTATTASAASLPSSSTSATAPLNQTRGYATSARPPTMEESMRTKLVAEFGPECEVNIRNDSSKHAHHAAMVAQGGGNGETHFYVHVISDKFQGMTQIKRHRAVNALLQGEFERGLHALSLRTKTWAEEGMDKPSTSAKADSKQESTNVDDPTKCPTEEPAASSSSSGSLWTAPQSHLHPTSPLAQTPSPSSTANTTSSAEDILSAFYTRPPTTSTIRAPPSSITPAQRDKFFRRATKNDALEPTPRQNLLNVIGAILATLSGTYMVLFADFGQAGADNCFTDIRKLVWGPEGPPKLFG